jgi:formate hydrogenlyase subunit 3/multisubunit Na+/H+ antiporter MnhD subunit
VLSGFVIEVALVVLVRLSLNIFSGTMLLVLGVLALAGVLVGEMAALGQKELKRALAFSSIGQVSMMLFAFTLGSEIGRWAGFGQLLMHAGAKSALFLVSGYFIVRTGSHEIEAYRGLGRKMPAASAFFAIAALSLVGMPPFFGFFTKLRILEAAAAAHSGIGYAGIVVILFATVIESIYLFRIVRTLYGANAEAAVSSSAGGDLPVFAWIAVAGFVLLVLVGGFIIPSFDRLLQPMAAVLATI